MKYTFVVFFILLELFLTGSCLALTAGQVAVVVNRNARHSTDLGMYYMKKRNIPEDNFLRLWTTDQETVTRKDYNKQIAAPIKEFLAKRNGSGSDEIRCLVIMFGMPLKIGNPELTKNAKLKIDEFKEKLAHIKKALKEVDNNSPEHERLTEELKTVKAGLKTFKSNRTRSSTGASIESELSLLQVTDYSLDGWVENPLFLLPTRQRHSSVKPEKVLLISRLDGPEKNIVKRIIDDSIIAESNGIKGTAYFDARWPAPHAGKTKELQSYRYYDLSIQKAAKFFGQQKIMPVVLDDDKKLFQKGDAPNAAVYCGWYSLAKYVDAFTWETGAVGFHIASGECVSLKAQNNQWCRTMLAKGAAVTLGPVSEPYLQAFPLPDLFFKLLAEGRLSLVECYYLSLPFLSWKMILIGDPLYRPFKKRFNAKG